MTKLINSFPFVAGIILLPLLLGCFVPIIPSSTVKNIYVVDWISVWETIKVEKVTASTKFPGTGLLQHSNVLSVIIEGTISGKPSWRPEIKWVHVAQEFPQNNEFSNHESIVIFSPMASQKHDPNYSGEPVQFTLKQNIRVRSMGYGINKFIVRAGQAEATTEFHQGK